MPTLGLCIITKEFDESVAAFNDVLLRYVDEIYIQVNGGPLPTLVDNPQIHFSSFKWCDDFAAARNALLKEVNTDYWLWLDTDDELIGAENLKAIVDDMEAQGLDRLFALYEYAKNDQGEEVAPHWRERIVRTAHPYEWKGVVHETLITDQLENTGKTDLIKVVHHKSQEDYKSSILRNHKILLKEYDKEPRDPRITMYLGLSLFTQQKWEEATDRFIEHIQTTGSDEDQYRSWLKVAECHDHLGNLNKAIAAYHEALKVLPNYPDAYFGLGQCYYSLEDYGKCLEWLKMGMSQPDPETLAIVDPTLRYRCIFMGAMAEFQRGHIGAAYDLIKYVLRISPNYKVALDFLPIIESAKLDEEAIAHTKWLVAHTATKGGKPARVLEALPTSLQFDVRLASDRNKVYPPKVWPKKSIVFFCGSSVEVWGPDTLDKGMGGSEEAVVYLSRELAKQGWQVTVYCERDDDYFEEGDDELGGVCYLPWHMFNPKDTFDVFIAWRSPKLCNYMRIKARFKGVDLHDMPSQDLTEADIKAVDKFFVKSQYHRDQYKSIPDNRIAVISNGILKEQFR